MEVHPIQTAEFDSRHLRSTLGAFATGVTVVTVGGDAPHGMTANSFTGVSLDPPLVSVCVQRDAVMHAVLLEQGSFAVSVLAADQVRAARWFADRRRPLGRAQFDAVDVRPGERTGAPLLVGAVAQFECRLWRTYDGGDHSIFLGVPLTVARGVTDDVLVFHDGAFRRLERGRR